MAVVLFGIGVTAPMQIKWEQAKLRRTLSHTNCVALWPIGLEESMQETPLSLASKKARSLPTTSFMSIENVTGQEL